MSYSEGFDLDDWITKIQNRYPNTPNRLTREIEQEEMQRLADWKRRLESIRSQYKEDGEEVLPNWVRNVPGGSLTRPVLWSATTMTEDEEDAWHRLFSCVVGQLAESAVDYWKNHQQAIESSIGLEDLCGYLPMVFLYVLGSYEPRRDYDPHEDDFSEDEDWVRLTTWAHIEADQHIRTYLRSIAYVVDRGSQTMHRVRSVVKRVRREFYRQEGRKPNREEVIDHVANETGYGSRVSRETVEERLRDLGRGRRVVSTEKPVGGEREPDARTLGDQIEGHTPESDHHVDVYTFVRDNVDDPNKRDACLKVLDTEEPLSVDERFWF